MGHSSGTLGNAIFRRTDIGSNLSGFFGVHICLGMECRRAGPDLMLLLEAARACKNISAMPEDLSYFGSPHDLITVKFAEEPGDNYTVCY